jgi:hypothetical protein
LNAIHERTMDDGELPVFRGLDKQLDLEGLNLRGLVESMPPGLMHPDVAVGPYILRDDDRLSVTLDGLRYCDRGTDALDLLGRGLAYLANRERPFIPTSEQPTLMVTSAEVRRDLGLTDCQLRQVRVLIYMYSHQSWTGMSGQNSDWGITVAPEYVRRFRGVRDGGQFLRALAGDSFDRQFDREETRVQLAATAGTPEQAQVVSAEVIERELNAHVAVAAKDLLGREEEITPENVESWAGTTGINIRVRCGESWELRFLAEGRGRGLSPRDELNTKIYFIHNELVPEVRRDVFKSKPRG